MGNKVLLIDDDPSFLNMTKRFLLQHGMNVVVSTTKLEAETTFFEEKPDIVILDIFLPDGNGIDLIPIFLNGNRYVPIVLISAQSEIEEAVRAMKLGATDYLKKPFEYDELLVRIHRAINVVGDKRELEELKTLTDPENEYNLVFSRYESMKKIKAIVDQVAGTDITVLITGESGTGKDLVARAIHKLSRRSDKKFVKVNCAAIPYNLLESELFGYEKGAFTSAYKKKRGKFEIASMGTIFLDEISEMPIRIQSKLLQVVQDGVFSPVGSERDVKVDVRIVSATNRDLQEAVREGNFREDLYFRLNVVNIHLPPLRERKEDIPLLVDYFLKKYSFMYNKEGQVISDSLINSFLEYSWPGNIRELENYVKRIVIMGSESVAFTELMKKSTEEKFYASARGAGSAGGSAAVRIEREISRPGNGGSFQDIDFLIKNIDLASGKVPLKEISRSASRRAERLVIEKVLNHVRWNRRKAAKILDISYKALLYKMKECGIVEDA